MAWSRQRGSGYDPVASRERPSSAAPCLARVLPGKPDDRRVCLRDDRFELDVGVSPR